MLEDIAILTGGEMFTEELGIKLENITVQMLGKAKRVTVTKDNTTIVVGDENKERVADRVRLIKNKSNSQILNTTKKNFKKDLQNFQAALP